MTEATRVLDELVEALQKVEARHGTGGDTIDQILEGPGRRTQVVSLREHESVRRFREDLTNGIIRVETAHQLFQMILGVLTQVGGSR